MLGQPQSMLIPEVVGFKLTGKLKEGVTATDLVLTVTEMLRKKGVVNKFVEFFGPGLEHLTLADRATIANMAPEYGATCGFFPVDAETLAYLTMSGRAEERITLVEDYCKAQGLFREAKSADPVFTDTIELDLGKVVPSLAGPKRPEGRVALSDVAGGFAKALDAEYKKPGEGTKRVKVAGATFDLGHGDVVIAAITSCTNTSNPSVLIGAGLLARNAVEKGLADQAVGEDLAGAGIAGRGRVSRKGRACRSISTSSASISSASAARPASAIPGRLPAPISKTINDNGLVAAAVLSGNRNFEGRVSPDVQANYLASPPLVVAYALAGTVTKDLTKEPLGTGKDGKPVYLKDIWPTSKEIQKFIAENITRAMFVSRYADVFKGDENWRGIKTSKGQTFAWDGKSTYVQNPPYFTGMKTGAEAGRGHRRRAHSRAVRRQDHHRPHLAGRLDQGRVAGRQVSHREQGRTGRFQSVRHAARQP